MLSGKKLKAIAAFIAGETGKSSKDGLTIDFDKEVIIATNGPCAVRINFVDGLDGKGTHIVPLNVVKSAIELIGLDGEVTATAEDFCGIPYTSLALDLNFDYNQVFTYESLALPGRPGLYPANTMKLLENLRKVFKGEYAFILPTHHENPLIFEIEPYVDEKEGIEYPEKVCAAVMPMYEPPLKNTFDGLGAKHE